MSKPQNSINESERLKTLRWLNVLDTPPEEYFDGIVKLVAEICQVPIALVSLVDDRRQWFKAAVGLGVKETPREIAFCDHAIKGNQIFEIKDATQDPRFAENPLVKGDPEIRFYAGAPLIAPDGQKLGSLCAIDRKPRELTEKQSLALSLLSKSVVSQFYLQEELRQKMLREQILKDAERDLELFFELSPDYISIISHDGRFQKISNSFLDNLGYEPQEMVGRFWEDVIVDQDRPKHAEALKNWQRLHCSYALESRLISKKDGSTHPILWRGSMSPSLNIFIVGRDSSAELKLRQSLELAKEQAEEAARVKGRFLANMSHEIRTPLNGILGTAMLLKDSVQEPENKAYVHTIASSSQSLLKVLNDILDASRLEAGKVKIRSEAFNIRASATEAINVLHQAAEAKGLSIGVFFGENLPQEVLGDEGRYRQVLLNLLSNAIKYSEKGLVRIQIHADREGDCYRIKTSVIDQGVGINAEDLKQVFTEYAQISLDKNLSREGSGLGLAISKQLCELMGGSISAESNTEAGSKFYFEIFVRSTQRQGESSEAPITLLYGALPQLKILVCEDNKVNQQVILRLLAKLGFEAELAENGLEALERIRHNAYDLVFMDAFMPEMDGLKATAQIRELRDITQPTIVALTASVLEEERKRCFEAGMDDFLPKPIAIAELKEILARAAQKILEAPLASGEDNKALNFENYRRKVLKGFDNDLGMMDKVARIYLSDIPKTFNILTEAFAKRDLQAVAATLHTIRGAATQFSEDLVVLKITKMIELIKEFNLNHAETLFQQLRIEDEKLRARVEQLLLPEYADQKVS